MADRPQVPVAQKATVPRLAGLPEVRNGERADHGITPEDGPPDSEQEHIMNTNITTKLGTKLTTVKRLAAAVAATMALGTVLVAAPADAAVVSSSGAAIETSGACRPGAAALAQDNYGFDYMATIVYVHGVGYGSWSSWMPLSDGSATVALSTGVTNNRYVAMYAYYADWNGYSWEFGGEWIDFGGTYWCYN
jgi:hypothetical protein